MTYDEIHPAMREAIGAFETLRILGFQSDDIFFHHNADEPPGPEPKGMMFVVLKIKDKSFSIRVGIIDMPYEAWKARWHDVATAARDRTIPPEELKRIVGESFTRKSMVLMMFAIQGKGIRVPVASAGLS